MLNSCRSTTEPCLCAWCLCGRQMSNRTTMPCPCTPAEMRAPSGFKNYRQSPCCGNGTRRPNPPEVAQDFPRAYTQSHVHVQENPGQLPLQYGYQAFGNCCQQSPRNDFQPSPWNGGQQSSRNDGPSQKSWRNYGQPTPPSCVLPPPPCCVQPSPPNVYQNFPQSDPQNICCGQPPPPSGVRPSPPNGYQNIPQPDPQCDCGRQPPPPSCVQPSPPNGYKNFPQPDPQCACGRQPPPPSSVQPSPPNGYQNFAQSDPQCDCGRQPPPCCVQPSPPNGYQNFPQFDPQNICCPGRPRKRRCRRPRRCCEYVVTHEVGVQTEGEPTPAQTPTAEIIHLIDVTTQEKEVKHRTGEVEFVVERLESVMTIPADGSQGTQEAVQTRIVSSKTVPSTPNEDDINPIYLRVPGRSSGVTESIMENLRARDVSELEPIMENLRGMSVAPSGAATPSEQKTQRVYRTNETYERGFGSSTEKLITQTITQDKTAASSPARKRTPTRSPRRESSPKSMSPSPRRESPRKPRSPSLRRESPRKARSPSRPAVVHVKNAKRTPSGKDVDLNFTSARRTPFTAPKKKRTVSYTEHTGKLDSRGATAEKKMEQYSEEHMVISREEYNVSSTSRGVTPEKEMAQDSEEQMVINREEHNVSSTEPKRKLDSRGSTAEKEMEQASEDLMVINHNVPNPQAPDYDIVNTIHMKVINRGSTAENEVERDSEDLMVINRNVPKPQASDFDNVSTIHMKVTSRKSAVSKHPDRDSFKEMALYERRISELLVMSPDEEEDETPEPEPKKKKLKRRRIPKMKMKTGYPSNDVVCRRQLCPPRCGAVCRGYSLPCICHSPRCCYPSCPPPCPRQCDPIYGFGSIPVAYYCH